MFSVGLQCITDLNPYIVVHNRDTGQVLKNVLDDGTPVFEEPGDWALDRLKECMQRMEYKGARYWLWNPVLGSGNVLKFANGIYVFSYFDGASSPSLSDALIQSDVISVREKEIVDRVIAVPEKFFVPPIR